MGKKRKNNRGKFIVLEGLDGAGTTTQANLLDKYFKSENWPVVVTSEPTQGPMGLIIRLVLSNRLIFSASTKQMEILSNSSIALLFAADRLDHLRQLILPKIEEGVIVICDRYYLSSYAYQLGNDKKNLDWLKTINAQCMRPDLTIYLDTSLSVCNQRRSKNRWYQDLYEKPEVLEVVAKNYEHCVENLKQEGESIAIVDGNPPEKVVFSDILDVIKQKFPDLFPEDLPLFSE